MIMDKVKAIIAYSGKTKAQLSSELNTSRQNMSNKLHRKSMDLADFISITNACGCKVIITDDKGFTIELNKDDI